MKKQYSDVHSGEHTNRVNAKHSTRYIAVAILALMVPAFALPSMAYEPAIGYIPPYPEPRPDWPDLLAFKGIAVNGEKIASAIFLGVERNSNDPFDFKQAYMLVDGEAQPVKIEKVEAHPERGAAILRLGNGDFIVVKSYQQEYRGNIFVVSGEWKGWSLNMRAIGIEDWVFIQWLQQSDVQKGVPESPPAWTAHPAIGAERAAIEKIIEEVG